MNRATRQAIGLLKQARSGAYSLAQSQIDKAIALIDPPRKATDKSKATRARVRARKAAKSEKHRMTTKEIRAFDMARADGECECGCGRIFSDSHPSRRPEMDHWKSGSGQRRERQTKENTWILVGWCHYRRTRNLPDTACWNLLFAAHCAKHGYAFQPHVEHAQVPAPQAPKAVFGGS